MIEKTLLELLFYLLFLIFGIAFIFVFLSFLDS